MSGWRPAAENEVERMWPAARAAHLAASPEELIAYWRSAPWRVRVSEAGDAMVLRRWREHLGDVAIRAAWAPRQRTASLVAEARSTARAQGFSAVLSPLLPASSLEAYLCAGMQPMESLVVLHATPQRLLMQLPPRSHVGIRQAHGDDLARLVELDEACFGEFWRYGEPEFIEALGREHVVTAEADGALVGYASCWFGGSTCTLGRLAVLPSARRRGVGGALLREAAAYAARAGALSLSLCTQEDNGASRALYRSAGLTEVGERYGMARIDSAEGAHRLA